MSNQSQSIQPRQQQSQYLNQYLQESLVILQKSYPDMLDYLNKKSQEIPLLTVKSQTINNISRYNVDWLSNDNQQDKLSEIKQIIICSDYTSSERLIFLELLNHIDSNGYLDSSWQEVGIKFDLNISSLNRYIAIFQKFEEPGFAARNLKECLYLQAKSKKNYPIHTIDIINNYLEILAERKWGLLSRKTNISKTDLEKIYLYLQSLSPAPVKLSIPETTPVFPEVSVFIDNNVAQVTRYTKNSLKFIFDDTILNNTQNQDIRTFVSNQRHSAQKLKKLYYSRIDTLLLITKSIVQHQQDFFMTDSRNMNPLDLKTIASETNLSLSTVSRTINSKYVSTPLGTFPLKHFFSTLTSSSGISQAEILCKISSIINNEDKHTPLSDADIAFKLNKIEVNISRRTISKYRNKLSIPSQQKRKSYI